MKSDGPLQGIKVFACLGVLVMARQKNRIQELDQEVEGVSEQYASIKEDLTGLRDDFTAFFHSIMDAGQTRVSDEVQQRLDDMRQRFNAVRDRGRDSMASMQSKIEEQ